jgi:Cysteine-rich secretory protein family
LWVALAGVVLCAPLTAVAQQTMPPEQRLLQLINQARLATGLGPLVVTPELSKAATDHADDMIRYGYMEHSGRDGSSPQQRAARAGYEAPSSTTWLVLEVISARQTPEAAANWLLSDALHRGVLLRNYWRETGAAYVQGGPYGQMWVVEFGCRPNVLPVTAEPNNSGGVTVRLSNEECAPLGRGDAMGKATEVMVSDKPDFDGAVWEPFVKTKVMNGGGNVFVKYRDSQGRTTMSSTQGGGVSPVIVTAASAATTTLNSATPPSTSNASNSATTVPMSAPAAPEAPAAPPPGPNLFEPKPGFVFQPGSSPKP